MWVSAPVFDKTKAENASKTKIVTAKAYFETSEFKSGLSQNSLHYFRTELPETGSSTEVYPEKTNKPQRARYKRRTQL